MEVCAFQLHDRPSPPLRFQGGVIINWRALNVPGWNVLPAGEFDRIVEPVGRQPRQSALELRERDRVFREEIQTDEGCASGIAGEPA